MSDFSNQYIEDGKIVHKAPRATLDALLPQRKAESIREVLAREAEEAEAVADREEAAFNEPAPQPLPFVPSSPIVDNALEILPHLGPDVTAAYIAAKVAGEEGEHEQR